MSDQTPIANTHTISPPAPTRTSHSAEHWAVVFAIVIAVGAGVVRWELARFPVGAHLDESIIGAVLERARLTGRISANWDDLNEWFSSRATYQYSPHSLTVCVLSYVWRQVSGWPNSLPEQIIFARRFSVVVGACTVLALFFAARQLFGSNRLAILAALLLAVSLVHVENSVYGRVEAMLGFFIVLCWYAAARALRLPPSWKSVALTGFLCGLAIAAKYNAAIILVLPLGLALRHLSTTDRWTWSQVARGAGLIAISVGGGVIAATPEVCWQPRPFFIGLVYEATHYVNGHIPHQSFGLRDCNLVYWTTFLGWLGFGWIPMTCATAFVAYFAWRGGDPIQRRVLAVYLLLAAAMFLVLKVRFERNLELVLGALCLAAAVSAEELLRRLVHRRPLAVRLLAVTSVTVALFTQPVIVLKQFSEAIRPESSPWYEVVRRRIPYESHTLNLHTDPEPRFDRYIAFVDYGDPFSEAELQRWVAKHPGCRIERVSSKWAGYDYPFSLIDVYHGPRHVWLVGQSVN